MLGMCCSIFSRAVFHLWIKSMDWLNFYTVFNHHHSKKKTLFEGLRKLRDSNSKNTVN